GSDDVCRRRIGGCANAGSRKVARTRPGRNTLRTNTETDVVCERVNPDSTLVGSANDFKAAFWQKLRAGHRSVSLAAGGGGCLECERNCNQRFAGLWLSGFEHHCAFLISSSDRTRLADSGTTEAHRRRGHRLAK